MATPSIFRTTDLDAMLARIRALKPDATRVWGKMDAAQMCAHCQVPLQVALGEVKLRRSLIGLLFGRMAKKSLLKPKEYDRDMPTAPEFRVRDRREFGPERERLLGLVERLGRSGSNALTTGSHPFFGALRAEEWDALMWKHLDHHLRQFSA